MPGCRTPPSSRCVTSRQVLRSASAAYPKSTNGLPRTRNFNQEQHCTCDSPDPPMTTSFRSIPGLLTLLFSVLLLNGCTTTEIDEFRQGTTSISADQSIVILGRRQNNNYETEGSFVNCVANVVNSGQNGISVVPEQEFLDAMFPFFEPRTAPMRTGHLKELMDLEVAAERMDEFGIQYIVWLDGITQRSQQAGSISCTIGPGGGGCFGFGTWQDDSNFEAEIWDMKTLD